MIDRQRLYRAGIWALTAPLPKQRRTALRRSLRARLDNRLVLGADFLVLSRAKSGRTWLRAMLSRLYQRRHALPEHQLLEYDNFHRQHAAIPVVAMTHGHELDKLARDARAGAALRAMPTVFLARDPRDVAVSEYFQATRRAADYKREMYAVEGEMSLFDFVMQAPPGLPAICDYLNLWHRELEGWDAVHRLSYEALRAQPEAEMARLCAFLGADFSTGEIAEAVAFASFEALKAKEKDDFFRNSRLRAKNSDDPDSFKVRRGKVGGYRDYFDAGQIAKIDAFVAERLDAGLGYR
ncbi:MAG: sulfotransferase domain-containing protein [Gammaproteobacteria bacterium]|nr:sulfotransferase domain-containing protein [Gammaproteobacteria bacterium]